MLQCRNVSFLFTSINIIEYFVAIFLNTDYRIMLFFACKGKLLEVGVCGNRIAKLSTIKPLCKCLATLISITRFIEVILL